MSTNPTSNRKPDHPIDRVFLDRWAPRSFSNATITEAELLGLFEAARWAPSASNIQPWRFAYGLRGDAAFKAIADSLMSTNATWAPNASALVLVGAKIHTVRNGAEVVNPTHGFDAGAAWENFAIQARMKGWETHGMGGFDHAKARANLNIPEAYALFCVVAVGKLGEKSALPEALQAREVPSQREPLANTVGRGSFPA
jgi:nitroreductase